MTNVVQLFPYIATRVESGAGPAQRLILRGAALGWTTTDTVMMGASDSTTMTQDPYRVVGSAPHFSVALITTFTPELYEVKKPLPISIYFSGDQYSASFFDANVHTTGENEQEAFENIKSMLLDIFDGMRSRRYEELGPGPRNQLSVLEQFISKTS
jgi:hypothetical protein